MSAAVNTWPATKGVRLSGPSRAADFRVTGGYELGVIQPSREVDRVDLIIEAHLFQHREDAKRSGRGCPVDRDHVTSPWPGMTRPVTARVVLPACPYSIRPKRT